MRARYDSDRIAEEAALWYVRAQCPDMSAADREAFGDWLSGSAEHVREYLLCTMISSDAHDMTDGLDIQTIIRDAVESGDDSNVHALSMDAGQNRQVEQTRRIPLFKRKSIWPIAASLILFLAGALTISQLNLPDDYSTGVGEQISFPLDDGSVVTLNSQSSIRVRFERDLRTIELLSGEALFDVVENPGRPFVVRTDLTNARAVGTSFNVRHRRDQTVVTVLEGIVDVDLAPRQSGAASSVGRNEKPERLIRVTVGKQVTVSSDSVREALATDANIGATMAWRERRVVFSERPLEAVLEELNFYNDSHIVIRDPLIAGRLITGTFSVDNRESFVLFLQEAGIAKFENQPDGTILLSHPR
jgi:transmembrane sensor